MSNLGVALRFLEYNPQAWLFPSRYTDKGHDPCTKWKHSETGTTNDPRVLREWEARWPGCHFCIAAEKSRMVLVDTDNKNGKLGDAQLQYLELVEYEELPKTLVVRTPSNGHHRWFKSVVFPGSNKLGHGIDTPGMAPVPGSLVAGKGEYKILEMRPLAQLPKWVLDLSGQQGRKAANRDDAVVELDLEENVEQAIRYLVNTAPGAVQGSGDQTAYNVMCMVRDFGISKDKAEELALEYYAEKCEDPTETDWLLAKVQSAYNSAQNPAGAKALPLHLITEVTEESLAEASSPDSPLEREIKLLNQEYAQTVIGKHEIIIREREKYGVQLLHPTAFAALEAHRLVPMPGKKDGTIDMVPATKLWRASRERRIVEGLCFEPGGCEDPNYINLWRGFSTNPVPGGSFEKYRWHVENVICSGDPELIKYTWAWIADIFQNPGRKPGVALCMRGERGVGKGVFVSVIKNLIGKRHAVQLNDRSVVTSQFNAILEDKILVFLDEAFWAGDKAADGRMKGYISEKEVSIERKGVDRITVSSYHRYILASNEDWFVNAGRHERRYLVLNVPATKMQDRTFFRDMFRELRGGGYEALMHWLVNLDISGVDLGVAPKTQGLLEQALESANLAVLWWHECLQNGCIPADLDGPTWPRHISTRGLYKIFEGWSKGRREYTPREGAFVKELFGPTGLAPCGEPGSYRDSNGSVGWGRKLPSLESCRRFFEEAMGGKVEWENRLEDEFADV